MPDTMEPLLTSREGPIVRLTFNRPDSLNALDVPLANAFAETCLNLSRDPEVRVVVLNGAGRAFVAGGDIAVMREAPVDNARALIDLMHQGLSLLARMHASVIASVHGVVAGGGLGVALAADLAIAAEGTRFNMAYANIGTSCDCSNSWALPRIVGVRKALEIALLSETFDAAEALRLGLVNRVVPADRLERETDALARRLAAGPPLALGNLKRLMRESFDATLEAQLQSERDAFLQCAASSDFREGVSAFVEKRRPVFRGE
ncbi:MAG: enoyl-CoA hydratase [Betaproteobacteria bacterium]|nr:enoyl-CoA hydratase [Betaproteobacteria bacterium]